jgi:hypothetical protein
MNKIIVEITSVPDRENLVAEIWHQEYLIAEVSREKEDLKIEFYTIHGQKLPLDEFLEALILAKNRLADKA